MPDVHISPAFFQLPAPVVAPVTIVDANGPGQVPKALLVWLSGHRSPTLFDTPGSDARWSIGMSSLSQNRTCGVQAEDADAAATAATSGRIDNTSNVIELPAQTGGGVPEVRCSLDSVGINQATIIPDAPDLHYGICIFIYGNDVQAALETIVGSASIGGTATSTALGREPDLVLAMMVNQAFAASSGFPEMVMSFGAFARSGGNQGCVALCAENQQSPTSSGSLVRNDCALVQLTSAAGVVSEGARHEVATTSTGFTVTTRNAAVSFEGAYLSLYLGGAACSVTVPAITSGSTGNKSVTGLGFRPKAALFGAIRAGAVNTVVSTQCRVSLGVGTPLTSGLMSLAVRDNVATSETQSLSSRTNVIDVVDSLVAHDWVASLVSMDADGLTINVSDAAAADRPLLVVAIGDARRDPLPKDIHKRRSLTRLGRM